MTTQQINPAANSNATAGSEPGGKKSRSLHNHIRGLLLECPSRQAFYQQVLKVGREQFGASVARIDYLIGDSRQGHLSHDDQMSQELADRFSKDYLEPFSDQMTAAGSVEAELKRYERGGQTMTLIAAPVMNIAENKSDAVISLLLSGNHAPDSTLPRLDGIAALASAVLVSKTLSARNESRQTGTADVPGKEANASSPAAPSGGGGLQTTSALAKASQFKSTKEFGFSIVNSLVAQLQAEQVSFGVNRDQRIVVEAISGVAGFKPNSPGVQIVRQSMEECVDHGDSVIVQSQALEGDFPALPIHSQWSAQSNNSSVFSIPLKEGDDVTGVISIRRSADRPFRNEEVKGLAQMLTPYGVALPVVEKANRSVSSQIKTAVKSRARESVKGGSVGRKVLLGCLLAGGLWFLFGRMTYRPICRTKVTAAELRHFSAPIDGKLESVFVKPGQHVRQGELLLKFDTSDLQLQLNSLDKRIATANLELREAMAADRVSAAALARSRGTVLQAEAAAIRKRIDESSIVAPFDGTVVVADLQQRVGQLFPRGEEVLQLAAEGDWLLEIEIPDDIANYVSAEQVGEFSAAAAPADKHTFTLQHVDGAAVTVEDRNVFIARAPLESRPSWMMTGMEGTARIDTVSRPVWWVAMHRAVDWARLNFWL